MSCWHYINRLGEQEMVVVVFQSLSHVWLFVTLWTSACQASLSFIISWSLLKLMSIELVMPSNHSGLCHPFSSCLQSFPASGSFQMSQFFVSGGQSIGISAFSPSNEYSALISFGVDWLDLLAVQGTLESSPTLQFKSINSSALSFLYSLTLRSIHDYWKNHSLD